MLHYRCYIAVLMLSAILSSEGRAGWLDRVVQYQKTKFIKEVEEIASTNINVEFQSKPVGYEDSAHWDYDSVLRLLTLIRASETAKPVHKALRRMLRPSRRIMMSMKDSFHRFPSLKQESSNVFYYDPDYTSSSENKPAPPVPDHELVLVVSNPVEARLPSARISVKLLREILEARSVAARQMPPTPNIKPWAVTSHTSNTQSHPNSTKSHPPSTESHPHSTDSQSNSTESQPPSTESNSHATESHPNSTETHPPSTESQKDSTEPSTVP